MTLFGIDRGSIYVDHSSCCVSVLKARYSTVAKDFEVQEKHELENLRFLSRYGLMTGSKVDLHQKLVHNMMRDIMTARGICTLVFKPP